MNSEMFETTLVKRKDGRDIRWQGVHALKIRNYAKIKAIRHLTKKIRYCDKLRNDCLLLSGESGIMIYGKLFPVTDLIGKGKDSIIFLMDEKIKMYKNELQSLSSLISIERKEQLDLIATIQGDQDT